MEQKLTVTSITNFDFVDRIKILFGRSVSVETTILLPEEKEISFYNSYTNVKLIDKTKHFIKQNKPYYGYSSTSSN